MYPIFVFWYIQSISFLSQAHVASALNMDGRKSLVVSGDYYDIPDEFEGFDEEADCMKAIAQENEDRNRYTDILPYDATRVKLLAGDGSDYINANHVSFKDGDVELHYIASQGPLDETVADFWQMVWEQKVSLICMMTGLVERGRIKCHKYWPDEGQTQSFGLLSIKAIAETDEDGFMIRTFVVTNGNDERQVTQCHFGSWPDHGVPAEAGAFLRFVAEVEAVKGLTSPTVLHCSAGIGRTGVLALTQIALALMQKGRVADISDIITKLRQHRMLMVQTESQYEFVATTLRDAEKRGSLAPAISNIDISTWRSTSLTETVEDKSNSETKETKEPKERVDTFTVVEPEVTQSEADRSDTDTEPDHNHQYSELANTHSELANTHSEPVDGHADVAGKKKDYEQSLKHVTKKPKIN